MKGRFIIKQISQILRDKLVKEGYLKNIQANKYNGFEKDIYISSITKNGKAKNYWICETVLFNYYYENNIQCDDKYYRLYCENRRRKEAFEKKNKKY